jgi:hypothetical protein
MKRLFLAVVCMLAQIAIAQNNGVILTGSIQSDILVPENDNVIGSEKTDDVLTNTYIDLMLQHPLFEAGARLEYMEHPLPGFENDFQGWGVPHFYVKGHLPQRDGKPSVAELTLGTFYEQFGAGFVLRTYEERSLGIDNSLLGGRLVLKPFNGVTVKALSGRQRRYWNWNKALVSGADVELNVDEWLPAMSQSGTHLMLGASWVNKHEDREDMMKDATHKYVFPKYVNAWDVRAQLNHGSWNLLAEFARKSQDPSADNGYIYRCGNVAMLSGSYSRRGFSFLVQAKRSENMAFRSSRTMKLTSSFINHMPAFTLDHTYTLAALYPYATQFVPGEWAYQAELAYNFRRNTSLGGKYGMDLKVNYSYVRSLNTTPIDPDAHDATDGFTSSFFKWGHDTYYQDLNVQLSRKLSHDFKLTLMYMNQRYNQAVVEGHGEMIHSNIFVADGKYQFSPKTTLRAELQYLTTKQDEGDWAFALAELSLVPHWMITVSDQWNCGESDIHYYQALVTYNTGSHRVQMGYGRVQEGYNCSGGVCRWIPAQKGFTLSYNYNF